jgi:hypothetical protein
MDSKGDGQMTENALMVRDEMSLADTMTLGETLAKSGYFADAREAAQAVVKVLAGKELGIGPIAAMTGINIIQGKVSVGGNLLASAVKRDPRYDYKVIRLDDDGCDLEFFEHGQSVGHSTFTMQNARDTMYWNTKTSKMEPLASKFNWKSYPRNMCFNRAISNGVKWYCPDATGGSPVYTPEELGAQTDADGEIIDVPVQVITEEQRAAIDDAAELAEAKRESVQPDPPTAKRHWPKATIDAIIDANLAKPAHHAKAMLNLSDVLRTTDELEFVMTWANHYRSAREDGKSPEQAARHADEQMPKPT